MAEGVYICTVYRDRPRQWRWLMDPKLVDTCRTTLDLADPPQPGRGADPRGPA